MNERPMLFVMRTADMRKVHPQTDYSHRCERCQEPVGIYPSGQKALGACPGIEIVCQVCAAAITNVVLQPLPGVDQEVRESVDVAKKDKPA